MAKPAWRDSLPVEHQEDWAVHAEFMNSLHKEGFVLLGGPLEGTRDVLLMVSAKDQSSRRGFCWAVKNLLIIKQI